MPRKNRARPSAPGQKLDRLCSDDPSRPAALLLGYMASAMRPRRALPSGRLDRPKTVDLLTGGTGTTEEMFRRDDGRDPRRPALLVVADCAQPRLEPAVRVVLFDKKLVIGRRSPRAVDDAAWVVPDAEVSARHAEIRATTSGFVLADLGSKNGTTLDGLRVMGPTHLRAGGVIFVGRHVAVFRTVSDADLVAIGRELGDPFGPTSVLSPASAWVAERLRTLALGAGEILFLGETGVGKEVWSQAVHAASGRSGELVAVNCAAIPDELARSELFGSTRGHVGAGSSRSGLLATADGGTLLLDHISEMSPELQARLLGFLQDRMIRPVGSARARRVNIRILATADRLGAAAASAGQGMRPDLAALLGREPVVLPPLRERIEDIGLLAAYFLRGGARRLTRDAVRTLCLYRWPGNVRELQKALRQADAVSRELAAIDVDHLPCEIAESPGPDPGTEGLASADFV